MAGQGITQLPASAIRLIGSGQVITSVYSVVKELVENAIDADATSLDIKVEDFGLEKVEISDNGRGIKPVDVPFVAQRHFTSKLVTTDDLLSLVTYGFRGEALVSSLTITTKTATDDLSYQYFFDSGGNVKSKKPSHLGTGTTITACNLFSNLPVRKQFYRSSQRKRDDLKRIEDFLIVIGIIKPNLRITFKHGRDLVWQKIPLNDTKGVLHAVLGRQVSAQLLYRQKDLTELQGSVSAYLPKPGSDVKLMSRSSTDRTFIVVNERPVHVKELVKVVKQYYSNCHACESLRHPVCYVHVKLPAAVVDVNVDPNKTTVFLQHMVEVRICLEEILVEVYGPLENVPSWHYSDTAKAKEEVTKERDKGQGSKISSKYDVSGCEEIISHESSRNEAVPPADDPDTGRQKILTPSDRNTSDLTPLPSFSLTFHQGGSVQENMQTNNNNLPDDMVLPGNLAFPCDKSNETRSHPECEETLNGKSELGVHQSSSSVLSIDVLKASSTDEREIIQIEDPLLDKECVQNTELTDQQVTANGPVSEGGDATLNAEGGNDHRPVSSSDWSKGHSIVDSLGNRVQPVQLLAPSAQNVPGKRPSSPANDTISPCPAKRAKISAEELPANQTTLLDLFSTTDFELFCNDRRVEIAESNPDLSQEEMNAQLKTDWEKLGNDEKMKYRDKCWQIKKRAEKEVMKPSDRQSTKTVKLQKVDVRGQVAALACQSQEEKQQRRQLRQRLYHCEKLVTCDPTVLRAAVERREAESDRTYFPKPTVIGQAKSCDAWFCCYDNSMYVVNVHRLGEVTLYKKLKEKHKLPARPCDVAIELDRRRLTDQQWSVLENLAETWDTGDIYFHVKDERLMANGFDILCHRDADHNLQAELVGLCDLIPAYNVSDLIEVLDAVSKNPSVTLANARSTKALYYLQGEAARMVQQSVGQKSTSDVQSMMDQMTEDLNCLCCIHHKPVAHNLFDLANVLPLSCSLEPQDDM